VAELGSLDDLQRAQAARLRAQIVFRRSRGSDGVGRGETGRAGRTLAPPPELPPGAAATIKATKTVVIAVVAALLSSSCQPGQPP